MSNFEAMVQGQRRCICEFMDRYPKAFGRPTACASWNDLVQAGASYADADRQALERALGMVMNVVRTSVQLGGGRADLSKYASMASGIDVGGREPTTAEMAPYADCDESQVRELAWGMGVYRNLTEKGILAVDALDAKILEALDKVPARTELMQGAVEAAKTFVLLQLDHLLGRKPIEEPASAGVAT